MKATSAFIIISSLPLLPCAAADSPEPAPAQLQIINSSSQPVDVFWVKSDTERLSNGSVAAGEDTMISTTLGHRFEIVGRNDKTAASVTSEVPVQGFRFDPPNKNGVPSFYTQAVSANGFPIVASAKVNPFALKEAAFLVDMMLAKRPDVRAAMVKSGARMCVMARNEFTTDLPEFARMANDKVDEFPDLPPKDFWDARARGLGGSDRDPLCTVAEENVLGYPGDPYEKECILIHEFAHNIHLRGMLNVDPTFNQRLTDTYNAAMNAGLWKGKYAATNIYEYFAEGVQSWFDNNRVNDHDHNHVYLRSQLIEYDPGLAAMCREVFGDTELKYTKPATRLTGHMNGYDPAKAPTFVWPERLKQAKAEIRANAEARATAANGDRKQETSATAPGEGEMLAHKPNIILIFIDDLGYGDVSPFGNQTVKTPHLDKMASEGMKFTSFYATPVCSMSRACLMTGSYNVRVSMPGVLFPAAKIGLHPDEITLAEIVKPQNYATTCIGKWHLGHREPFLPTKQGFDSYFGIPYSNDMTIDPVNAVFAKDCVFRDGMNEKKAREGTINNAVPLMRDTQVVEYPADQTTLTKRYTEEAVKFIRASHAKPFFIYLPHTMVHVPLAASAAFRGKSAGGLHGDAVEEIDWSVGQILQTLQELNLDSKTLVIFTSDNGAATGTSAPWRGKKGSIFEGGVREPCIMRWPGRIPAGTICKQIAGNIDLLPTFAKITATTPPPDRVIDGRDITSLMFKADSPPVRDTQLYFNAWDAKLGAIRHGDWKLFLTSPTRKARPKKGEAPKAKDAGSAEVGEGALVDLAKDPYETTDVAPAHADVVARLRAAAQRHEQEIIEHRRPAGEMPKGGE